MNCVAYQEYEKIHETGKVIPPLVRNVCLCVCVWPRDALSGLLSRKHMLQISCLTQVDLRLWCASAHILYLLYLPISSYNTTENALREGCSTSLCFDHSISGYTKAGKENKDNIEISWY